MRHHPALWSLALGIVTVGGCGRIYFDEPLDGSLECPATYERIGPACYRLEFNMLQLSWLDAEAACEADGLGGHLAVIDDAAELDRLTAVETVSDASIGLNDRLVDGVYRTVTDVPPFLSWAPGQPNDTVTSCATLRVEGMHDHLCEDTNEYICEYDGLPVIPAAFQ